MKKRTIVTITITCSLVAAISLSVAIPFVILGVRTNNLESDYSYLKSDSNYCSKVEITNLDLVKQHVSCGYATIEMLSSYYGNKVNEDDLDKKNNGAVSTSSSNGFLKEINESIPTQRFVMASYLKNDELLKSIHSSIKNNHPVAIEWAAKYEGEWTLHFSVVSGLDIINNQVTIYNPYGYIENISLDEFINRTSFKAYENMPLFLNFGFAFGAFDKNVIFYAK